MVAPTSPLRARPVSVEILRSFVKAKVDRFEPDRQYHADLRSEPESAAVLAAMQAMYLGLYPKDMSTYFQAGTSDHALCHPVDYASFSSIFDANTRHALLQFHSSPELNFSSEFGRFAAQHQFTMPFLMLESKGKIIFKPANIVSGEEQNWRGANKSLIHAVDAYFSYRGRPAGLLNATMEFMSGATPLLYERELQEVLSSS